MLPSVVESLVVQLNNKCKAAFSVLIIIAADTWRYDKVSTISRRDIMKRTGLSADGVTNAIKVLVSVGLVKIKSTGRTTPRTFRLDYAGLTDSPTGGLPTSPALVCSADHLGLPTRPTTGLPTRPPRQTGLPTRSLVSIAAASVKPKTTPPAAVNDKKPPLQYTRTSSRLDSLNTKKETSTRPIDVAVETFSAESQVHNIMLSALHVKIGSDKNWFRACRLYTEKGSEWFTEYCEWFQSAQVPKAKRFIWNFFLFPDNIQEFDSSKEYEKHKPRNPRVQDPNKFHEAVLAQKPFNDEMRAYWRASQAKKKEATR
jgi:hypothetical protein